MARRLTPDEVATLAGLYEVPAALALAVYGKESSFGANPKTSAKGAQGGFQVMPATFREMMPDGNIKDPVDNAIAGIKYLAKGLKKYGGDPEKAAQFYYHGSALGDGEEGPDSGPGTPSTRRYGSDIVASMKDIDAQRGGKTTGMASLATPSVNATSSDMGDEALNSLTPFMNSADSGEEEPDENDLFGTGMADAGEESDLGSPENIAGFTGPLSPDVTSFGGPTDMALNAQGSQDYELDSFIRKLVDEELKPNTNA